MFLTMSVGLTLTMFIPQELGHVLKKDFLHQLMLPHCSGLSSLLAAPLMTQSPALNTETHYWAYGALSTLSQSPACQGTRLRGRGPRKESPSQARPGPEACEQRAPDLF